MKRKLLNEVLWIVPAFLLGAAAMTKQKPNVPIEDLAKHYGEAETAANLLVVAATVAAGPEYEHWLGTNMAPLATEMLANIMEHQRTNHVAR